MSSLLQNKNVNLEIIILNSFLISVRVKHVNIYVHFVTALNVQIVFKPMKGSVYEL